MPKPVRSRRSSFRSRGTSSTATRARWPGGSAEAGPFEAIVCITRGGLVPAAIVARELGIRADRDGVRGELQDYRHQGEIKVLKGVAADDRRRCGGGGGKGVLIVDDLVDTGKTAKVVREILPEAHFATVYAKPMGRPLVDTFITEVSQDTWIYFPWDTGLAFQPPIREGGDCSDGRGCMLQIAHVAPISRRRMPWTAVAAEAGRRSHDLRSHHVMPGRDGMAEDAHFPAARSSRCCSTRRAGWRPR